MKKLILLTLLVLTGTVIFTSYTSTPENPESTIFSFEAFFPAEKYHQDFLKRNPTHPYIVYWDIPKIEHLKKSFPELLTEQ